RSRKGHAEGGARAPQRSSRQRRVHVEGGGGRRREGVRGSARYGGAANRTKPAPTDGDGATRGVRELQPRNGPAHLLGDEPEPAHPPVPPVRDDEAPG